MKNPYIIILCWGIFNGLLIIGFGAYKCGQFKAFLKGLFYAAVLICWLAGSAAVLTNYLTK